MEISFRLIGLGAIAFPRPGVKKCASVCSRLSAVATSLILFASPVSAIDDMEVAERFCKLGRSDPQQAIGACSAYVNKGDPKNRQSAYLMRGNAYAIRHWWDNARADFDIAVKLNPKSADAYNNRGRIYLETGRQQEALADFNAALKLNPKHANAYNSRGWIYLQTGRPQEAVADFDRAIALENSPRSIANRKLALKAIAEAQ